MKFYRILFFIIFCLFFSVEAQVKTISFKELGALENSSKDQTSVLLNAIQYCTKNNKALDISGGAFQINSEKPIEITCSILGNGTLINKGNYLFIKKNISISGISISGGNIDGKKGKGIYVLANDVILSNLTISNIDQAAISAEGVDGLKIINIKVNNCSGVWGDGILLLRSKNCIVSHCLINNVSRAGIVTDTNVEGHVSQNIQILNNKISNANNASGGEMNGGIWLEYTNNAVIKDNIINNCKDRGIVITPGIKDNNVYKYSITGNVIENSKYLIAISGELNNAEFVVSTNKLGGSFERGITFGANFGKMQIEGCTFNAQDNDKKNYSLIYIDMYGGWRKSSLIIKNCKKIETSKINVKRDVNSNNKDINIYNGRFLDSNITLDNWSIQKKM